MLKRSLYLLAVIATIVIWGFAAQAHPSAMVTGALTSQPIGHLEFCKREPRECSVRSRNETPLIMSDELLRRLQALTVSINKAVKPKSDLELYGQDEYWTYPVYAGDCEDYALAKRRVLLGDGVSASNLLLTVLRGPNGDGHAVLTVRTNIGDVILDNLTDSVLNWDEAEYIYLKRQATNHTGRWVSIREGDAPLVGSLH